MRAVLRAQGRLPVTSLGPSSLSLVHAYHVLGPVSAHLSLPTLEWHPSCGYLHMVTWEETGPGPGLGALAPPGGANRPSSHPSTPAPSPIRCSEPATDLGELGGAGSSGCFPGDPPAGPTTLAPNRLWGAPACPVLSLGFLSWKRRGVVALLAPDPCPHHGPTLLSVP